MKLPAVLCAALVVGAAGTASAFPLDGPDARCAEAIIKRSAKVLGAYGKVTVRCVKDIGKGKVQFPGVGECLRADSRGKLGKARARLDADIDRFCGLPYDGMSCPAPCDGTDDEGLDGIESTAELKQCLQCLNPAVSWLGPDEPSLPAGVHGAVLDGVVLAASSADKPLSRCQADIVKAYEKLFAAAVKEVAACQRSAVDQPGLSEPPVGCIGAAATSAKTAKARARLAARAASCGTSGPFDAGACSGATGDPELTACLDTRQGCGLCRWGHAMVGAVGDCDAFDDGVVNGSCSAQPGPSTTTIGNSSTTVVDASSTTLDTTTTTAGATTTTTAGATTTTLPAAAEAEVEEGSARSVCGAVGSSAVIIQDYAVPARPDSVLIVGVAAEHNAPAACDLSDATVTWGGQAMTFAVGGRSDESAIITCSGLFYLLSPAAGTADITVSLGAALQVTTAGALVAYNVSQAAPVTAHAGSDPAASPVATAVGPVSAGALVVDLMAAGNAGTFTPMSGQTLRWASQCGGGMSGGTSTLVTAAAGTPTIQFGHSNLNRYGHTLAGFAPSAAPSPTTTTTVSASTTTTVVGGTTTTVVGGTTTTTLPAEVCDTFAIKWGTTGVTVPPDLPPSGTFSRPRGVAIGPDGNVYVVDAQNDRVQVFTPEGLFFVQWGSHGQGAAEFDRPRSLAFDPAGNVWATDRSNHRVQRFGPGGGFLAQFGALGTTAGLFNQPQGVAVAPNGDIYVADSLNNRIQQFAASGAFIRQWGSLGLADGQFQMPRGVATDGTEVFVVDADNSRVQVFDMTGGFLRAWGSLGSGTDNLRDPRAVALDAAGRVYVADRSNHRIQVFDAVGTYLTTIGSFGVGDGQLNSPRGVAVDGQGRVFVTDTDNDRVQRFDCPAG